MFRLGRSDSRDESSRAQRDIQRKTKTKKKIPPKLFFLPSPRSHLERGLHVLLLRVERHLGEHVPRGEKSAVRETLATRREEVRLRLFALALDEIAHGICREPGRGGDAESRTGSADRFESKHDRVERPSRACPQRES